ncbi:hypothetical protein TWF481_005872 [Arthrobotrys musiformis]|uniref:RING-type E3 ubiquitin transferase n=1 Tax=Arthrobotrys musiformis TaxID=47236 RepID=A0AAV9WFM2_9PEZI
MSGLPPRQQPSGNQPRELVYCHSCQNEWYRDQHGLVCPDCQSDFTEILEGDSSNPGRSHHHHPMFDSDDDDDDDEFHEHHHHHPGHLHHQDLRYDPAPHGTGFTLRMGGNSGPHISFRTIQQQFGSNASSPPPHHPFGGGHVIGGISPNPRQPSFPSSPFDNFHAQFPGSGARSMRSSPLSEQLNQQRDGQSQDQQNQHHQQQQQDQQQQQQRSPSGATPNFGNSAQPIADMFTSIIQNILGVPREGDPNDNARNPAFHVPGAFPGSRSPPGAAGQNDRGQGQVPSRDDGLGGPGHSPGTVPSPGAWPHGSGSPLGMPESPLFMQMPGGRGGVTYYSSTRTWTGPNGEVRTIRTSSPMPPHGHHHQGMPDDPAQMNLANILVNIIGANAHGDDNNGFPPLLRAFGLGHGQTGDYAWNQQDMDRILSQLMDQHQGNAPPPASEDSIKNLPKVKVTQAEVDDGSECVICQDEYKADEEVVKLPCKHIYHEECVTRWLETHDACPICRTPITPEDQRRQRPAPGAPGPGAPGPGFPPLPSQGGNGGPGGSSGAAGGSSNMHTASGSGGGNGARWSWSASFGRG